MGWSGSEKHLTCRAPVCYKRVYIGKSDRGDVCGKGLRASTLSGHHSP